MQVARLLPEPLKPEEYDAGCNNTPLTTKIRISIYTRPTVTKVFDKLSREVSVKHASYNWRNSEASYKILFVCKCLFLIFSGFIG